MNLDRHLDAVLFDLDGVLTSTTTLHIDCWKRTFDPVLADLGQAPFDAHREYADHVDGKPRYDGVRDFLRSRGVDLDEAQVVEIGDRKQVLVERALARDGVEAFPGSERWVRVLRARGIRTAVVSSSANAPQVLRAAGIDTSFDEVVDGGEVARLGLRGSRLQTASSRPRGGSVCLHTGPPWWRTRWPASPPGAPVTSGS